MSSNFSDAIMFDFDEYGSDMFKKVHAFYERREFFDMALIAGMDNVKVEIHRIVLSAASDYFLGMFRSTLQEAKAEEIRLEDLDGALLRLLVDFMYTGTIELRGEIVEDVLKAADFLQMELLIEFCCDFMEDQLDPCNCLGIALLAEQRNFKNLYEIASTFVYTRFEEVCGQTEFLQLNAEQLNKFLSSDDIGLASCEKIFHSLVAWVEYDSSRDSSFASMLSHIRFARLEPAFIVENSKSVCRTPECCDLIRSWLAWHSSHEICSLTDSTDPGKCKLHFLTSRYFSEVEIQAFNPKTNKWSPVVCSSPPIKRFQYSGTVVNKSFIFAGGSSFGVECFDLQTMKWSELPLTVTKRNFPGIILVNRNLYSVGGCHNNGNWSDYVGKYSFSSREWQSVSPLPANLERVQVVALDGLIYAVGAYHPYLECYDPVSNKWTQKSFKNERSESFGMAAVNGRLYAVGGHYNGVDSKTVECYEPSKDAWTVVASLNVGRSHISCTAFNNRLIACGGRQNGKWVNLVDEYNPATNEWETMTPLLSRINDFCFAFSM